jgi:hypothetical protein
MGGREVDKVWLVVYVCMLRYEVPCSMLSILRFVDTLSVTCNVLCMAVLWLSIFWFLSEELTTGKCITRSRKRKNWHGSHPILQHVHPSPSSPVKETDLSCPCLTCSVKLVQVGVKEVVYNVSYSMDTQAEDVMRAGGVIVRQFSPPQEGLIW